MDDIDAVSCALALDASSTARTVSSTNKRKPRLWASADKPPGQWTHPHAHASDFVHVHALVIKK